jgi:hypothetical protein
MSMGSWELKTNNYLKFIASEFFNFVYMFQERLLLKLLNVRNNNLRLNFKKRKIPRKCIEGEQL